jgi:hypothetical protein
MRTGLIFLSVTAVVVLMRGGQAQNTGLGAPDSPVDADSWSTNVDGVGYPCDRTTPSDGYKPGGAE